MLAYHGVHLGLFGPAAKSHGRTQTVQPCVSAEAARLDTASVAWLRAAMKHILAPALLGLLAALPARADTVPPGAYLAALTGDWNADGNPDFALLMQGDDATATLVIRHGDGRQMEPVLTVPGVAFAGPMWGQSPGLEGRSDSSFAVTSGQSAVGRSPWEQQVTLAWRNGAWVVAGFTLSFYDRLDLSRHGRCDVNLLNGRWEVVYGPGEDAAERNLSGSDGPRAFPAGELTEAFQPEPCRLFQD